MELFHFKGRRRVKSSQRHQPGRERIPSSSTFLFYLSPQRIGRCRPTVERTHCSTQSTHSSTISPRNTRTGTPRSNVLPAVWTLHDPGKFTHEINHHRSLGLQMPCSSLEMFPETAMPGRSLNERPRGAIPADHTPEHPRTEPPS